MIFKKGGEKKESGEEKKFASGGRTCVIGSLRSDGEV